jgi:outer membrane protein, heavy metal efflux system
VAISTINLYSIDRRAPLAMTNTLRCFMSIKKYKIVAVLLLFPTLIIAGEASAEEAPKNLDQLIEELLEHNPELQSLVAQINAAHSAVPQSSALDDPRLSFEASNIPMDDPSLSRTPMSGYQIYLRQKIPFPGKLGLKKKIAKSHESQKIQEHQERLNQLVAKFKVAFFDYAYLTQAIAVSTKTQIHLQALASTLEARYAAGQVPQQDVLKTKLEVSKIKDRLIHQRALQKTLLSRMNRLLGRSRTGPLSIAFSTGTLTQLHMPLDDLRSMAQTARPWLIKEKRQVEEATFAHNLAKRELLPDFDFSAGYRIRDNALNEVIQGEDFFSAGVSINIPLWSFRKQGKKITQTRHHLNAAKQQKEALAQEITYQVEKLFYEAEQLRDQYDLYRSRILPETRAALAASKRSYEANEVEYLNVITNELGLFNNQLALQKYYFEHEKKIAELEMAVGKPLTPSKIKGNTL